MPSSYGTLDLQNHPPQTLHPKTGTPLKFNPKTLGAMPATIKRTTSKKKKSK